MKRKLLDDLIRWNEQKNNNNDTPILITGTRGVGKTYLAFDFSKSFYSNCIYINFERHTKLASLFQDTNPYHILERIEQQFNTSFQGEDSILILDEFVACPSAIDFIIQCSENKITCSMIAISSKSYPYIDRWQELISRVYHLTLYPFDFEEYLWSTGNEWYSEVIREHYHSNKRIPDIVHKELMDILDQYLIVGGMPRAINEYINTEALINISEQHHSIMESFYSDAIYHTNESTGFKVKNIANTMDLQIAKKNKKFQYKLIRKGASKNLYQDAINYMNSSNILIHVSKLDSEYFKAYLCDVGLQLSLTNEHFPYIESDDQQELRKGLIENYIAQNLIITHSFLYFWESNAQAKIDFLIKDSNNDNLIPIEVSIDHHTRSKSLSIFKSSYDIKNSIKISSNNFGTKNNIKYVPLYAVFCI